MPLHHYLPATYLGSFSGDEKTLPRRQRMLFVGDKSDGHIFSSRAAGIAAVNNLYTLLSHPDNPELIEKIWTEYESNLSEAIDQLINRQIDAKKWARLLGPFVACMFVRGPDFDKRFVQRFQPLGLNTNKELFSQDNINSARLIELQRLIGPIIVAKWIVVTIHGRDELITNDLGYAPFINPLTHEIGIAIPLDKSHILSLVPRTEGNLVVEDSGHWIPIIEYVDNYPDNHIGFNRAVANTAQRYIFGPDRDTLLHYLKDAKPNEGAYDPAEMGFITDPLARAHEFTWHRLAAALERDPRDGQAWDFPLDWKLIAQGWCPPVLFPLNLIEFPPALRKSNNVIQVEFYDPSIFYALSSIKMLEEMGEHEAVITECNKSIPIATDDRYKVRLLIAKAGALTDLGKWDEGLNYYDEAIFLDPSSAIAYCDRGYCLIKSGHNNEAIDSLTRAIELDPLLGPAYLNRGSAYTSSEKYDMALNDFSQAVNLIPLGPSKALAFFNRGNAYIILDSYQKGIDDLTQAISLYPNPTEKATCYYRISVAYHLIGMDTHAIQNLDLAIELNSSYHDAFLLRGQLYIEIGKPEIALGDLESAIKFAPDNETKSKVLNHYAIILTELRKFDEANRQFDLAIELASDTSPVIHDKGLSLVRQGKIKPAIDAFQRVIDLNPDHSRALNDLGYCLTLEARLHEASNTFERALIANPDNETRANILRNQAICQALLSNFPEADKYLSQALNISPRSIQSYIARGRIEWFRGNIPESLKYHKMAQRMLKSSKGINDYIVIPLLTLGKSDQALRIIHKWLKTNPMPLELYSLLVEINYLQIRFPDTNGINDVIELLGQYN